MSWPHIYKACTLDRVVLVLIKAESPILFVFVSYALPNLFLCKGIDIEILMFIQTFATLRGCTDKMQEPLPIHETKLKFANPLGGYYNNMLKFNYYPHMLTSPVPP